MLGTWKDHSHPDQEYSENNHRYIMKHTHLLPVPEVAYSTVCMYIPKDSGGEKAQREEHHLENKM